MYITGIINNITENAIKYSAAIPINRDYNRLRRTRFIDNNGMSRESINMLEKFIYQPKTHNVKGFGLGLCCKS
jgi:K+-sensing histidine kinase KdpD